MEESVLPLTHTHASFEFEVVRNAISNVLVTAGLPCESYFHCQKYILKTQLPLLKIHSFIPLLSKRHNVQIHQYNRSFLPGKATVR